VTRSGAPATSGHRRRLGRDERRDSIVVGASRAFAGTGFTSTSMADIAGAAGVSHLIVYRHFDSKLALYVAVLERATVHLARGLAARGAIGTYGPTPGAMLAAARADETGFRILWRHATREPEFTSWVDGARRVVEALTRDALTPIVPSAHREWAVRATGAYLVDAVLHWIEDGDPSLDSRFVVATDAALGAGVRAWAQATR
jgi:AcrR family transcriptional regulator